MEPTEAPLNRFYSIEVLGGLDSLLQALNKIQPDESVVTIDPLSVNGLFAYRIIVERKPANAQPSPTPVK